jgi:prepilin peptidase CpaA
VPGRVTFEHLRLIQGLDGKSCKKVICVSVLYFIVVAVSLISIATDIYRQKIYNLVLLPAGISALAYRGATGGWSEFAEGLLGLGVGMVLLIIPYLAGGVGAGDVKLLGTLGACGGMFFVLYTFLGGALLGGVVSCYLLGRQGRLRTSIKGLLLSFLFPGSARFLIGGSGLKFPYGVMFCLAAFVVIWLRW